MVKKVRREGRYNRKDEERGLNYLLSHLRGGGRKKLPLCATCEDAKRWQAFVSLREKTKRKGNTRKSVSLVKAMSSLVNLSGNPNPSKLSDALLLLFFQVPRNRCSKAKATRVKRAKFDRSVIEGMGKWKGGRMGSICGSGITSHNNNSCRCCATNTFFFFKSISYFYGKSRAAAF